MTLSPVKPILQALILADAIYIDANTGKKVIAGTFNRVAADEFPDNLAGPKHVLVSLTSVHGSVEVTLRFVDLSTSETLVEMRGLVVHSSDPLETVELVVEIPPLPMPHPGAYALEAHWNNEMLGLLRVFVEQRNMTDAEDDEESDEEEDDDDDDT